MLPSTGCPFVSVTGFGFPGLTMSKKTKSEIRIRIRMPEIKSIILGIIFFIIISSDTQYPDGSVQAFMHTCLISRFPPDPE
jgi:hypothetical protein